VDEPVVNDGAADLLVEFEQRLHLVHRDFDSIARTEKNRVRRHCK
jgi:thiamine pyrophosphokinase